MVLAQWIDFEEDETFKSPAPDQNLSSKYDKETHEFVRKVSFQKPHKVKHILKPCVFNASLETLRSIKTNVLTIKFVLPNSFRGLFKCLS